MSLPSEEAARFLRSLRIIDQDLFTDPGHALVRPVHFAEWMTGPVPVPFLDEAHALLRLCDFAEEHDLLVAWGH